MKKNEKNPNNNSNKKEHKTPTIYFSFTTMRFLSDMMLDSMQWWVVVKWWVIPEHVHILTMV